jgi:hypothetical protein
MKAYAKECFRDPSELAGQLTEFPCHPLQVARRFFTDPEYARRWWQDIRYYRACDYFCGRTDIDRRRLAKFTANGDNVYQLDEASSGVEDCEPAAVI